MCIGVFIINGSCNGVVFNCKLDVEKRQGMFCYVVSKLESWMEVVGVVDEILQGFKRTSYMDSYGLIMFCNGIIDSLRSIMESTAIL